MKKKLAALTAVVALAGCASAPIVRTGENEYAIGDSGRDALRSDSSIWSRHVQRAYELCGNRGGRAVMFDPAPPDGRFHFRCDIPPPPVVATEAQITAAFSAWTDCLASAELPIDDRISDANTIASTLATRCPDEFKHYVEVQSMGRDAATRQFIQGVESGARHQVARDIVLRERAKRLSPGITPPPVKAPRLVPGTEKL